MKRLFTLILMCTMWACSQTETENQTPDNSGGNGGGTDTETPVPDAVAISQEDFTIPTEGQTIEVTVTSSSDWTMTGGDTWCEPSKKSGKNGDTVSFVIAENKTDSERTLFYTFRCGSESANLHIVQRHRNEIVLTKSIFELEKEGGEITIELSANVDFTFEVSPEAQSWLRQTETRTMFPSTFVFTVDANDAPALREGSITFTDGTLAETVHVYQNGVEPSLAAVQKEFNLTNEGQYITVDVTGNVDIELETDASVYWISRVESRALSTKTYAFYIERNVDRTPREAVIAFVNRVDNLRDEVKISQQQCDEDALEFENQYTIGREGGEIEIVVWANLTYHAEPYMEWIHEKGEPVVQGGKHIHTYIIDPNDEESSRFGVISICTDDFAVCYAAFITQEN